MEYLPNDLLPRSIINLSSAFLHRDVVSLLNKGQKFIPTPIQTPKKDTHVAIDRFRETLRKHTFFSHLPIASQQNVREPDRLMTPKRRKALLGPSTWLTPMPVHYPEIDDLIKQLHSITDKRHHSTFKSNCTPTETIMLHGLKKETSIVIKPADKGSAWVIMDSTDYEKEANRQLSQEKHYCQLPEPLFLHNATIIDRFHHTLLTDGHISRRQYDWLQQDTRSPRGRIFYMLPKIHKEMSKWTVPHQIPPGRPVVSDVNSENYRTSAFIDYYLYQPAIEHPSYIRDTYDFLQKLRTTKVPANAYLATIDVDAMYTNINTDDGMAAIRRALQTSPETLYDQIAHMMDFILRSNDFSFNGQSYLQLNGTAMGKIFSPHYADIYMAEWEKTAFRKSKRLPLLYLRYLDDIFIVWHHTKEEFLEFFQLLNTHHPSIKLKYTLDENTADFLDVTVYKGKSFYSKHILDTRVYFKPTDTHDLLHRSSFHPRHTFSGILKSQILRFYRICNNHEDFQQAWTTLSTSLLARGYSKKFLHTVLTKIKPRYTTTANRPTTKPCNRSRCSLCPYLSSTATEPPLTDSQCHLADGTCASVHCIYMIYCLKCTKRYVGQTINLRCRLLNHISRIRNGDGDTLIINHFGFHGLHSLRVKVLEYFPAKSPQSQKDKLENKWIKMLHSLAPDGLNEQLNAVPAMMPFPLPYSHITGPLIKATRDGLTKIAIKHGNLNSRSTFMAGATKGQSLSDILVRATFNAPTGDDTHPDNNASSVSNRYNLKHRPTEPPLTWISRIRATLHDK